MIRVLQLVSPTGYYGAERWIVALAGALDPTRVACSLAVTSDDPRRPIELMERYPAGQGAPVRLELAWRFDPRVVVRLSRLMTRTGVQIVHSHGYKSDIVALAAARIAGVAAVSTPHGTGASLDLKLRAYAAAGRRALRGFDAVAPLSEELRREALAAGIRPDRVRLIPNGVDLKEIRASVKGDAPAPDPAAGPRLGYAGRLVPGKQVDHLLRAFDRLWAEDPALSLEIVGDGPERAALEALARALASHRAIRFHGFSHERFALMRAFDLFVLTSRSEGTPRTVMEAHALGVPVVAYDIAGVRPLVQHESTGLLARLDDVDDLEAMCRRALGDRAAALARASQARSLVETAFSADRMASDYVRLYDEVLERRGGRRDAPRRSSA